MMIYIDGLISRIEDGADDQGRGVIAEAIETMREMSKRLDAALDARRDGGDN